MPISGRKALEPIGCDSRQMLEAAKISLERKMMLKRDWWKMDVWRQSDVTTSLFQRVDDFKPEPIHKTSYSK